MAKIKVAGKAVVIESEVLLSTWKLLKKYAPKKLELLDEDKQVVFSVLVGKSGNGEVADFGIQFAPDAPNGFASVTLTPDIPEDVSVEDFVADEYGKVIMLLNKIEETVTDAVEEVAAERAKIFEAITVA